jgi:hypothetical protein
MSALITLTFTGVQPWMNLPQTSVQQPGGSQRFIHINLLHVSLSLNRMIKHILESRITYEYLPKYSEQLNLVPMTWI